MPERAISEQGARCRFLSFTRHRAPMSTKLSVWSKLGMSMKPGNFDGARNGLCESPMRLMGNGASGPQKASFAGTRWQGQTRWSQLFLATKPFLTWHRESGGAPSSHCGADAAKCAKPFVTVNAAPKVAVPRPSSDAFARVGFFQTSRQTEKHN